MECGSDGCLILLPSCARRCQGIQACSSDFVQAEAVQGVAQIVQAEHFDRVREEVCFGGNEVEQPCGEGQVQPIEHACAQQRTPVCRYLQHWTKGHARMRTGCLPHCQN